ncbi:uridylate-specific endoribonuclease A-like [Clavelina lepadiformis]|uniref:uridylate-specific endoribonuclease A-like n=1 Tax=Clavelina lepadiformis TaxID=159417 RepID=UPI004042C4AE
MLKLLVCSILAIGLVHAQGLSSCVGRCDDYADHSYTCQCNTYCDGYQDCCDDYTSVCLGASDSCVGRCGESPDTSKSCQCNTVCDNYNDCCADYVSECQASTSLCAGRCGIGYDATLPCQCNTQCPNYGNCCTDYSTECDTSDGTGCSKPGVTQEEIYAISLSLYDLDVNRATASDYIVDIQSPTSDSSLQDNSPYNFFTFVNEDLLNLPTYQALINLLDNYEMIQGKDENVDQVETDEIYTFLNAFMSTEIGKQLYTFLSSKGLAGCEDEATFIENLKKMWFDLYSRQNNAMDTSGFEHVFVGEIKTDIVSGFHNWVQFYLQEQAKNLNYFGYTGTEQPNLYGLHFEWYGYMKGLSGSSVGSSPEYDFAIFTLCHLTRPGSVCNVLLRSDDNVEVNRSIQTWTWTKTTPGDGLKYVASAYFIL